jgi:hypothetical protein
VRAAFFQPDPAAQRLDIAPRDDRSPPAPALAAPRPTFGRFIRGVIRRLPWGVIGVVIVIGGLVLGARAVLELDPSAIGVAPTITPTRTATSTRAPTNTPAPTATTPPTAVPVRPTPTVSPRATYVVRFGDTCGDIAEQFSLSVRELAASCDHLVLAAPSTPQTRHLINAEVLAQARPGLHLINIGRGALVDQVALLEALDAGRLSRATLDVTDPEPLPAGHPLYRHPKVRVSPHTSAISPYIREALIAKVRLNLGRYLAGEEPIDRIHPEG